MKRLLEFFQSHKTGQFSSSKLSFNFWSLGVLIIWSILSARKGELLNIPNPVVYILALFLAGRGYYKYIDSKNNVLITTPNTTTSSSSAPTT